jgi:hypothetical protein
MAGEFNEESLTASDIDLNFWVYKTVKTAKLITNTLVHNDFLW